jgi:hypothetical protein
MRVIGARAVPIPDTIDMYHLTTEYPPTEETALEAVMSVDAERAAVEKEVIQRQIISFFLTTSQSDISKPHSSEVILSSKQNS